MGTENYFEVLGLSVNTSPKMIELLKDNKEVLTKGKTNDEKVMIDRILAYLSIDSLREKYARTLGGNTTSIPGMVNYFEVLGLKETATLDMINFVISNVETLKEGKSEQEKKQIDQAVDIISDERTRNDFINFLRTYGSSNLGHTSSYTVPTPIPTPPTEPTPEPARPTVPEVDPDQVFDIELPQPESEPDEISDEPEHEAEAEPTPEPTPEIDPRFQFDTRKFSSADDGMGLYDYLGYKEKRKKIINKWLVGNVVTLVVTGGLVIPVAIISHKIINGKFYPKLERRKYDSVISSIRTAESAAISEAREALEKELRDHPSYSDLQKCFVKYKNEEELLEKMIEVRADSVSKKGKITEKMLKIKALEKELEEVRKNLKALQSRLDGEILNEMNIEEETVDFTPEELAEQKRLYVDCIAEMRNRAQQQIIMGRAGTLSNFYSVRVSELDNLKMQRSMRIATGEDVSEIDAQINNMNIYLSNYLLDAVDQYIDVNMRGNDEERARIFGSDNSDAILSSLTSDLQNIVNRYGENHENMSMGTAEQLRENSFRNQNELRGTVRNLEMRSRLSGRKFKFVGTITSKVKDFFIQKKDQIKLKFDKEEAERRRFIEMGLDPDEYSSEYEEPTMGRRGR